jgi:NAD(P)H-nitrite reductase large subunit
MQKQSVEQKVEDVICECSGTTRRKIQQLLNKGVNSVEEIAQITGATTGCGSCDMVIAQLLTQSP